MLSLAYLVREALPLHIEIDIAPDDADQRDYNVTFEKSKTYLGFDPQVTITQGIKEIYFALKSGQVDFGVKTITVNWYKHILEAKDLLAKIVLDGRVI
jgi:hypothetical protein